LVSCPTVVWYFLRPKKMSSAVNEGIAVPLGPGMLSFWNGEANGAVVFPHTTGLMYWSL
jgi:hypothetical protein